jgi:lysophospholipase L1-like esterase
LAVVNEGIVGNRLLRDADVFGVSPLARFDRDALVLPGVTYIVLLEGINDICFAGAKTDGQFLADPAETRSAQDIINAYRQLISRTHARGIKVIGATITPCEGVDIPGYYSDAKGISSANGKQMDQDQRRIRWSNRLRRSRSRSGPSHQITAEVRFKRPSPS